MLLSTVYQQFVYLFTNDVYPKDQILEHQFRPRNFAPKLRPGKPEVRPEVRPKKLD